MLSKELGTKLTGRHITKELFHFSYTEFIRYKSVPANADTFLDYIINGGFPEYVKTGNNEILTSLVDDILYRDIAVRFNIRDTKSLKHLLVFLISNVGNLITATKLSKMLGIKSTATVLDYLSYFEQSYLLAFLPKFSFSYRAQIINPRKINGLAEALGHFEKTNEIIITFNQKDIIVHKEKRITSLQSQAYFL